MSPCLEERARARKRARQAQAHARWSVRASEHVRARAKATDVAHVRACASARSECALSRVGRRTLQCMHGYVQPFVRKRASTRVRRVVRM
eukprot:6189350-Pleurochrysis_carterae.AAC.2